MSGPEKEPVLICKHLVGRSDFFQTRHLSISKQPSFIFIEKLSTQLLGNVDNEHNLAFHLPISNAFADLILPGINKFDYNTSLLHVQPEDQTSHYSQLMVSMSDFEIIYKVCQQMLQGFHRSGIHMTKFSLVSKRIEKM